jgi:hypothetical protein
MAAWAAELQRSALRYLRANGILETAPRRRCTRATKEDLDIRQGYLLQRLHQRLPPLTQRRCTATLFIYLSIKMKG